MLYTGNRFSLHNRDFAPIYFQQQINEVFVGLREVCLRNKIVIIVDLSNWFKLDVESWVS